MAGMRDDRCGHFVDRDDSCLDIARDVLREGNFGIHTGGCCDVRPMNCGTGTADGTESGWTADDPFEEARTNNAGNTTGFCDCGLGTEGNGPVAGRPYRKPGRNG